MDYAKFYGLENYLFKIVGPAFRKTHKISVEDFFCIVIWKANRAKTNIKRKLCENSSLERAVNEIAMDLADAKTPKQKLEALTAKWKFGLPMATAILTVMYPTAFTVYDYRVREELGLNDIYSVNKYFTEFLPKMKKYAASKVKTLREADKELWGKSFYADLQTLIKN
jgi:hypothetical protein